jgi:molybdopterin converting factor subunit 1
VLPENYVEIEVRYFAIIRELLGCSAERRQITAGATAGQLFDDLVAQHPRLEKMRPVTMLMVNKAYVGPDHPLKDGDEVALIPPVSGGETTHFRIQSEPLDPRSIESSVADPGAGAIVTFIGTVRDHGRGRSVARLDYEAYAPAAEAILRQIGDEIRERWGLDRIAIVHRVGSLVVGEASVVICVAAPHRDAAFEACRYAIERIKEIVPIWKKEHYSDGVAWIGSEHDYQVDLGRLKT